MTLPHSRVVTVVAGSLFAALAAACQRSAAESDSLAAAGDEPPAMTARFAGGPGDPAHLTKDWKKMSATEMRDFLKSFERVSGAQIDTSAARECRGGADTDCRLEITPFRGTAKLRVADVGIHGTVLAVVRNIGTREEQLLKLPAGDSGYVIAYQPAKNSDSAKVRAVVVRMADPGKPIWGDKRFGACPRDSTEHEHLDDDGRPHPKKRGKAGGFAYCTRDTTVGPPGVREQAWRGSHRSPPWMSCVEGCCAADADAKHR